MYKYQILQGGLGLSKQLTLSRHSFKVFFSDVDECFNDPCLHHALGCKNTWGSYECQCASGYTGIYCQIGRLVVVVESVLLPCIGLSGCLVVENNC